MIQIVIYSVTVLTMIVVSACLFDHYVDKRGAEFRRMIRRLQVDNDHLRAQTEQLVEDKRKLASELDRMFRKQNKKRRGRRGPGQR